MAWPCGRCPEWLQSGIAEVLSKVPLRGFPRADVGDLEPSNPPQQHLPGAGGKTRDGIESRADQEFGAARIPCSPDDEGGVLPAYTSKPSGWESGIPHGGWIEGERQLCAHGMTLLHTFLLTANRQRSVRHPWLERLERGQDNTVDRPRGLQQRQEPEPSTVGAMVSVSGLTGASVGAMVSVSGLTGASVGAMVSVSGLTGASVGAMVSVSQTGASVGAMVSVSDRSLSRRHGQRVTDRSLSWRHGQHVKTDRRLSRRHVSTSGLTGASVGAMVNVSGLTGASVGAMVSVSGLTGASVGAMVSVSGLTGPSGCARQGRYMPQLPETAKPMDVNSGTHKQRNP
ncbi:hypothetical protein ACOMHN_007908 [Nucella lapillus]